MSRSFSISQSISEPNSDLVILSMDGLKLLLPQSAIQTLEPALDVEVGYENAAVAGSLAFEGKQWPVHCLSKDFMAMSRIPETRRFCVLLNARQEYFCLLCDNLLLLKRNQVKMTPIPNCMNVVSSPFRYLAILEEGIGCVSSADHLLAYLQTLKAAKPKDQLQGDKSDFRFERGIR